MHTHAVSMSQGEYLAEDEPLLGINGESTYEVGAEDKEIDRKSKFIDGRSCRIRSAPLSGATTTTAMIISHQA